MNQLICSFKRVFSLYCFFFFSGKYENVFHGAKKNILVGICLVEWPRSVQFRQLIIRKDISWEMIENLIPRDMGLMQQMLGIPTKPWCPLNCIVFELVTISQIQNGSTQDHMVQCKILYVNVFTMSKWGD